MTAPVAQGRVLATLNGDGSRRWIRPKPSFGGFWQARRVVAYALIVMYLAIPHISMNGRPLMLLDIVRRDPAWDDGAAKALEVQREYQEYNRSLEDPLRKYRR